MKARFTFSSRVGLINVVTCLILTPSIGLVYHTSSATAQTKQSSGDTADRQVKSAVQRQLDAIYARDGQRAPNLSSKEAVRHLSNSVPPSRRLEALQSPSRKSTKVQSRKSSVLRVWLPRFPKLTGFRSSSRKTQATRKTSETKPSKIVQASQEATKTVQKTEVQRKLEEPHKRDGRPIPEMTIPSSRTIPQTAQRTKTTTRKPSFLSRFFQIGRKSKTTRPKPAAKTMKTIDSEPRVLPAKIRDDAQKSISNVTQKTQPNQTDSKIRTAANVQPADPPVVKPAETTKAVEPAKSKPTKAPVDPFSEISKTQSLDALPLPSTKDSGPKPTPRTAARLLPDDELIKKAVKDSVELPSVSPGLRPKAVTTAKDDQKKSAGDLPKINPANIPKNIARKPSDNAHANKFKRIVERKGVGLKGFCVVTLKDQRALKDSNPQFKSKFEDVEYHFFSAKAKTKFDKSPTDYAPVGGGIDIVLAINKRKEVDGKLDHAVWYKDRLYLFSSRTTLEEFVIGPGKYALAD